MSVTFDNAVLRSEQVIDLVRETGAPDYLLGRRLLGKVVAGIGLGRRGR